MLRAREFVQSIIYDLLINNTNMVLLLQNSVVIISRNIHTRTRAHTYTHIHIHKLDKLDHFSTMQVYIYNLSSKFSKLLSRKYRILITFGHMQEETLHHRNRYIRLHIVYYDITVKIACVYGELCKDIDHLTGRRRK